MPRAGHDDLFGSGIGTSLAATHPVEMIPLALVDLGAGHQPAPLVVAGTGRAVDQRGDAAAVAGYYGISDGGLH